MSTSTSKSKSRFILTSIAMKLGIFFTLFLSCMPGDTKTFTTALKHSFTAKHDKRFIIGPIGTPYGFLENGEYHLTVSSFHMTIDNSDHDHSILHKHPTGKDASKHDEKVNDLMEETKGLHSGFLLKRFANEAAFAKFQQSILDNPTQCGFGDLKDELDERFEVDPTIFSTNSSDVNVPLDNTVARGPGVVDGGAEGIFMSMNHKQQWTPNTPKIVHAFTAEESGYYFLFYQVCLEDAKDENGESINKKFLFRGVKSTFHLEFEYKNVDAFGKMSYLTAGEMPLPHMYLYFSFSYAIMLFLWVGSMKRDGHGIGSSINKALGSGSGDSNSTPHPTVYAIHHLMSGVLVLKTLSIFFESVRFHFIRVKGHAELWSFLYYGFTFVKGTFLFTVILLIGSGWSFFKPFLTAKERRIIFFVFFLQVIDNIAIMVLTHETMGEKMYDDWSAVLHLVDIVSCCAILIPIVWQVNSLEQSLERQTGDGNDNNVDGDDAADGQLSAGGDAGASSSDKGPTETDPESERLHEKLALFRFFYLAVVAYIYFTRIVVYLIASWLSYNHTWMRYLFAELGTLLFYVVIGVKFKPKAESEYTTLQQGDDGGIRQDNVELGAMSKLKD